MLNVALVRPGCTDYDQQGRIQGTLDIPLCEQGRQEVAKIAADLKDAGLEIIYTSPCRSAPRGNSPAPAATASSAGGTRAAGSSRPFPLPMPS